MNTGSGFTQSSWEVASDFSRKGGRRWHSSSSKPRRPAQGSLFTSTSQQESQDPDRSPSAWSDHSGAAYQEGRAREVTPGAPNGRDLGQMPAAGYGCGHGPAAVSSLACGSEPRRQSLTLASGPCQDSAPNRVGNSRFPRHATRGWALLPGLSVVTRAASGIPVEGGG